jgi:uncharacterized protein YjbI with pentapeptide repeats
MTKKLIINQEQLDEMLENHKKYLKGTIKNRQSFVNLDFSKCDLDFYGMDLTNADFSNSIMRGADFSGAMLDNATFSATNLIGANFEGALLNSTSFFGAGLSEANFFKADGHEPLFRGADIRDANFEKVTFRFADFFGAYAEGTDFTGSDLENANFESAKFNSLTDFRQCVLNDTNFNYTDIHSTFLAGADTTGAVMPEKSVGAIVEEALELNREMASFSDLQLVNELKLRLERK